MGLFRDHLALQHWMPTFQMMPGWDRGCWSARA